MGPSFTGKLVVQNHQALVIKFIFHRASIQLKEKAVYNIMAPGTLTGAKS